MPAERIAVPTTEDMHALGRRLATGLRAGDLVVLSGLPFELSTRVLAVMIDGQWVYQEEDDR